MLHVTRIRRLRMIAWEESMRVVCPTLSGARWQAVCRCGWTGDSRRSRHDAQTDARQHVEQSPSWPTLPGVLEGCGE